MSRPDQPATATRPIVVLPVNVISFVVFISEAIYDPTLTIGGYVVLSLLMLWSVYVAGYAAWEMTRDAN